MKLFVIIAVFLLTLFGGPTPSAAQDKMWRVGLLSNGPPPQSTSTSWRDTLLRDLAPNGFSEGKNLEFIDRYSQGYSDRLPKLAHEISDQNVDVIVAISSPSVRAALAATKTTPIISVGSDPVADGLASSYARPGGRVTGIVFQVAEGDAKRLELLSEALPSARHFGFLGMSYQREMPVSAEIASAATRLGIELTARWIDGPAEYSTAFDNMRIAGAAGVVIAANQPLASDAQHVAAAAAEHGLPAICEWEYMAHAGCVLSYGHDLAYAHRRTAEYLARILRGTAPADLPVERSDAWKLTVNSRAAQQFGITFPQALFARATEVIE
jgi:putative ABC transport system substrate-binding protein